MTQRIPKRSCPGNTTRRQWGFMKELAVASPVWLCAFGQTLAMCKTLEKRGFVAMTLRPLRRGYYGDVSLTDAGRLLLESKDD